MANSLSAIKMTNPIRGLVSKRRIRYTQDGFDLDLTYISDRIIAMGYPAEHMESIYRNKIEDVQKMLEKNHPGCYKIYNLCSERSYNHKRFQYYAVYPFKDHNPPDIELITAFCRDVDEHLRADSKNVVAVHCKAGKGRTGTMICCYLLYSGQFNTAAEALHYYAQRRTSDSKGVTIPSQRRYVEYYATLLRSNETYQPVTLYICEIRIAPVLNSFKEGTISVTGKSPMQLPEFKRAADEQLQYVVAKLDYCMPLAGDVKVELVKSSVLRKEKRCHFWFNTYFVERAARKDAEGNLLLELSKSEIDDAHKDKHHKEYPNNFMVALVLRRVPNGRFSDSVSLKTTSSLITCAVENNRHAQLYSQNQHQQMLLHHSPLQQQLLQQQQQQQQQQHHYRQTIIKHNNSSPDGFLQHDQNQQHQQHHHQLQQHQQQNSLPQQQNKHHNNHQPQQQQQQLQQQQQQQNLTDKQQYFKVAHENSQQQQQLQQHYVDDHPCLEYSETSSSESSTEEEGWDSGEFQEPDNANLYYRNDNYYYGSCAGLSSGPSGPMRPAPGPGPGPGPAPAPAFLRFPPRASSTTSPSGGGSQSNSQGDVTEPKRAAQPNHNDSCRSSGSSSSSSSRSSGRRSSKPIGSSKLNQSLANTTFATSSASSSSSSGKPPLVVPAVDSAVSSGVLSSGCLTMRVSVPRLPTQTRSSARNNSSNSNGSLPSSAASELTTKASPTGTIAVPSTNRNAWSSIGLRRKKKKSFKANGTRSFAGVTREFGSTVSACSGALVTTPGKVKSGKGGRFHKLRWLRNMRSDHNLKEVLAQSSDIMTLTHSNVTLREPAQAAASAVTLPIVVEHPPAIPTAQPSTASNENLLSTDYYSSICDKQLSFESPCKSPGHLMKLNLARRSDATGKTTTPEAVPDSECAIVIAKPSEQRLKIGFDVSPTQSPTSKAVPDNPLTKPETPGKDSEKDEVDVDGGKSSAKSWSLAPKQENASFCDRILQSLSGMGSKKSSSDQELQVPSPPATSLGGSPIAPRANRYSPFSFRELHQELKSVMKPSSQTKLVPPTNSPPPPPPTSDGNPTEEATSETKQGDQ